MSGVGWIMGAQGNHKVSSEIAVTGRSYPTTAGGCYAITAKYDGLKEICVGSSLDPCFLGGGKDEAILGFKVVGESTEISTSQYQTLIRYARTTKYQAGDQ